MEDHNLKEAINSREKGHLKEVIQEIHQRMVDWKMEEVTKNDDDSIFYLYFNKFITKCK